MKTYNGEGGVCRWDKVDTPHRDAQGLISSVVCDMILIFSARLLAEEDLYLSTLGVVSFGENVRDS